MLPGDENNEGNGANDENVEPIRSGRKLTGGDEIPCNFQIPKFEWGLAHALSLKTPLTAKWEEQLVKKLFEAMKVYVTDL